MNILLHFLLALACAMTVLKSAQAQCTSATWGKVQSTKPNQLGPYPIKSGTGDQVVKIPFKGMPGCHLTGVTAITCDSGDNTKLVFVGDYSVHVLRSKTSSEANLYAFVYCEAYYGQDVHDYHFDDDTKPLWVYG